MLVKAFDFEEVVASHRGPHCFRDPLAFGADDVVVSVPRDHRFIDPVLVRFAPFEGQPVPKGIASRDGGQKGIIDADESCTS